MLIILTHFDSLLGLGGNTHCVLIRVGRSRNLVRVKRAIVFWQAIASCSLPSVSGNFSKSMPLPRVPTKWLLPHFNFAPKIFKIHPPKHATSVPIWLQVLAAPSSETRPHDVWSYCIIFLHVIFSLKRLSDLPLIFKTSLAECIGAGGAFKLCSPPGSANP